MSTLIKGKQLIEKNIKGSERYIEKDEKYFYLII